MTALASIDHVPAITEHDWIAAYRNYGCVLHPSDRGIWVLYGDDGEPPPVETIYRLKVWEAATPDWKDRVNAALRAE